MSFVNATLVLSIGETVEEVTDSGFLGTTPTLSCSLLGDDALVQVRGLLPLCVLLAFCSQARWPSQEMQGERVWLWCSPGMDGVVVANLIVVTANWLEE